MYRLLHGCPHGMPVSIPTERPCRGDVATVTVSVFAQARWLVMGGDIDVLHVGSVAPEAERLLFALLKDLKFKRLLGETMLMCYNEANTQALLEQFSVQVRVQGLVGCEQLLSLL